MKRAGTEMSGIEEILERKKAELVEILRKRDGIAIEKSADQMDEITRQNEIWRSKAWTASRSCCVR